MTGERVLSYSAHQCVQGPVFIPITQSEKHVARLTKINETSVTHTWKKGRKSVGRGEEEEEERKGRGRDVYL